MDLRTEYLKYYQTMRRKKTHRVDAPSSSSSASSTVRRQHLSDGYLDSLDYRDGSSLTPTSPDSGGMNGGGGEGASQKVGIGYRTSVSDYQVGPPDYYGEGYNGGTGHMMESFRSMHPADSMEESGVDPEERINDDGYTDGHPDSFLNMHSTNPDLYRLDLMADNTNLKIRLSRTENDLINSEEKLRFAQRRINDLQSRLNDRTIELSELRTRLASSEPSSPADRSLSQSFKDEQKGHAQVDRERTIDRLKRKHFEVEKLRQAVESLIMTNEEKDNRLDEMSTALRKYRRLEELLARSQGHQVLEQFGLDSDDVSEGSSTRQSELSFNENLFSDSRSNHDRYNVYRNGSAGLIGSISNQMSHVTSSSFPRALSNGYGAVYSSTSAGRQPMRSSPPSGLQPTRTSPFGLQPTSASPSGLQPMRTNPPTGLQPMPMRTSPPTSLIPRSSPAMNSSLHSPGTRSSSFDNVYGIPYTKITRTVTRRRVDGYGRTETDEEALKDELAQEYKAMQDLQLPRSSSPRPPNPPPPAAADDPPTSVGQQAPPMAADSEPVKKRSGRNFKRLFGKVKRSRSQGPIDKTEEFKRSSSQGVDRLDEFKRSGSSQEMDRMDESIRSSSSLGVDRSYDFKRTGLRSTAGPRIGWSKDLIDVDQPFVRWDSDRIALWLHVQGLSMYVGECKRWVKNGEQLLQASAHDLEKDDLIGLRVTNTLHHLSVRRGIQILRTNDFNPTCLKRRPAPDEGTLHNCPEEVQLWSSHRVMEWLRNIDLSEYAPNLRGSGVHGGLLVLEPRFSADLFASILSIPPAKTLLRRHLSSHFIALIGSAVQQQKRDVETQPGYLPLTTSQKVKMRKRIFWNLRSDGKELDLVCPMDIAHGNDHHMGAMTPPSAIPYLNGVRSGGGGGAARGGGGATRWEGRGGGVVAGRGRRGGAENGEGDRMVGGRGGGLVGGRGGSARSRSMQPPRQINSKEEPEVSGGTVENNNKSSNENSYLDMVPTSDV